MTITLDTNNANSISSAKLSGVKASQQKQTSETQEAQQTQTAKTDRVELSVEARQYLTEESADTSDTSAEISSSELYSYTDDQLSELLSKGEITQLQYNTEMAKRAE